MRRRLPCPPTPLRARALASRQVQSQRLQAQLQEVLHLAQFVVSNLTLEEVQDLILPLLSNWRPLLPSAH